MVLMLSPQHWGDRDMLPHLTFCKDAGDLNSGPEARVTSTLTTSYLPAASMILFLIAYYSTYHWVVGLDVNLSYFAHFYCSIFFPSLFQFNIICMNNFGP